MDHLDHAVTQDAMDSVPTTGRAVAVCGADLIPAALCAPRGGGARAARSCPGSGRPITGAADGMRVPTSGGGLVTGPVTAEPVPGRGPYLALLVTGVTGSEDPSHPSRPSFRLFRRREPVTGAVTGPPSL